MIDDTPTYRNENSSSWIVMTQYFHQRNKKNSQYCTKYYSLRSGSIASENNTTKYSNNSLITI